MGWSIGYDSTWHRDIGYGVPAWCDHPDCNEEIDRGLAYVCGGEPYGGDNGCGLYFCGKHLHYAGVEGEQVCELCEEGVVATSDYFDAKPDHPTWIRHKLTDASWSAWRADHRKEVVAMRDALAKQKTPADAR